MEFYDVYNQDRRPLGKIHNRKEKLLPGEFIVVVGIWVFNSKNEILLTKRDSNKSFAPNLWENTGGHVRTGESSEQAVVRELEEETGISIAIEDIHFLGTVKVPPFFGDNYYVRKDIPVENIKLQEGETVAAQWVSYERFLEMVEQGELAPSVFEHLQPIRDNFDIALFV